MCTRKPRIAAAVLAGLAALIVILWAAHSWPHTAEAQDAAKPDAKKDPVDEKSIRALIAQLADDSFEKREMAEKRLVEIGEPAKELLAKAVKDSTDPELRDRAAKLIQQLSRNSFVEIRRFEGPIA